MFKKIFLLLIIFIFVANICDAKNHNLYKSVVKNGKIVVGISFESKPFGYMDTDGQVKGFEADLAREIAQRLLGDSSKVEFKDVKSQDRIGAVDSGAVDMVISTMTITPSRRRQVDFSIPYFVAGQAICVKKDDKIDSIYDLINKKVIVIIGTTGEKNIKRFAPNVFIQGYNDNSEAIDAFIKGEADAITTDDALLQGLVAADGKYKLLPMRLTREPYGIAFKKSRHTKLLRQKVNEIIQDMKSDGTLQAIKDKWITD